MTASDPARPTAETLQALLLASLPEAACVWLSEARAALAQDPGVLHLVFPGAARAAGRAPLDPDDPDPVWGWTTDEAARVLLLVAAGTDAVAAQLPDLYRHGDSRERRAALHALDVLDVPAEVARPLVLDALRANEQPLVAAALGPGGCAVLDDGALVQAVLKAVFSGLDLGRVAALPARATPGMARALAGYVLERVAAGRRVPPSVWPVIDAHPPADVLDAISGELDSAVPERAAAARVALQERVQYARAGRMGG